MRIEITMINDERFSIEENIYTTLYGFIKNRLNEKYLFLDDSYIDVIMTSNIVRVFRTDGHTNDDSEEMPKKLKTELSNALSTKGETQGEKL